MKTSMLILLLSALFILSGNAIAAGDIGTGQGEVADVIKVESYTYLRLEDPPVWLATTPRDYAVGDKVDFRGGMEMRNFYSKTLDRTFESIIFVQNVSRTEQDMERLHSAAMQASAHGAEKIALPRPAAVEAPAPGEITPLSGGKTVAQILDGAAQLRDQTVKLRAKVTKVNTGIMGSNWITLQDGTGTESDNKLLATSSETVEPGDLVVVSGTLGTDIDIGSGYTYKVLLQEARFVAEKPAAP